MALAQTQRWCDPRCLNSINLKYTCHYHREERCVGREKVLMQICFSLVSKSTIANRLLSNPTAIASKWTEPPQVGHCCPYLITSPYL